MCLADGSFIFPESLVKHCSCSILKLRGLPIAGEVTGINLRATLGVCRSQVPNQKSRFHLQQECECCLSQSLADQPSEVHCSGQKLPFIAVSLRSRDHPCQGFPAINTFVILTKEAVDLNCLGLKYYLCLPLHGHLGYKGIWV